MKLMKNGLLTAFFLFSVHIIFAQTQNNVTITKQQIESKTNYLFPIASYNENNISAHIHRISTITESTIEHNHDAGILKITIDPIKVDGYNLQNLLQGIAILCNFTGYELQQN